MRYNNSLNSGAKNRRRCVVNNKHWIINYGRTATVRNWCSPPYQVTLPHLHVDDWRGCTAEYFVTKNALIQAVHYKTITIKCCTHMLHKCPDYELAMLPINYVYMLGNNSLCYEYDYELGMLPKRKCASIIKCQQNDTHTHAHSISDSSGANKRVHQPDTRSHTRLFKWSPVQQRARQVNRNHFVCARVRSSVGFVGSRWRRRRRWWWIIRVCTGLRFNRMW